MIKEIARIKIDEEYKEKVFNVIDSTIRKVVSSYEREITDQEINKIKNLSLDQINVNVASRANMKTLWGINIESNIPILIERAKSLENLGGLFAANSDDKRYYKMKNNFTWSMSEANEEDSGLTKKEFHEAVLSMLIEDAETASFYGALSLMDDAV